MLDNIKVEDVLFLDIETVPASESYQQLSPSFQTLWEKKSKQFRTPDQTGEDVYERAGIYSEFGRIICISVGLVIEKNPVSFRLKSFYGHDEKVLLTDFSEMLVKFCRSHREATLCAHNGKEFDFP
jgi:3'-5' exonuclease